MTEPVMIFLIVCACLALIDFAERLIPNAIVIPSIFLGGYLTGHWVWAVVMIIPGLFLVGIEAIKTQNLALVRWHGGDVMLGIMAGAFLGWRALLLLAVTVFIIRLFRFTFHNQKPLPVAPFMFVASLLTLATIRIP